MLGKIGTWRHVVAVGAIGGTALLAATGVIGRGHHDERFDSKVVTVEPIGDNGVRIREVVDEDFGTADRHGYQRIIPTDFGEPTDIEASSPDANADIDVTSVADGTRIRLGDPDATVTGQHRYVLAYTLPDAQLSSGQLALDIIGTDETLQTGRFEVDVRGLDLDDPKCNVGSTGDVGGCSLERDGDVYRATFTPLEPSRRTYSRSSPNSIRDESTCARRKSSTGGMGRDFSWNSSRSSGTFREPAGAGESLLKVCVHPSSACHAGDA